VIFLATTVCGKSMKITGEVCISSDQVALPALAGCDAECFFEKSYFAMLL
jgi:hypothetical protein